MKIKENDLKRLGFSYKEVQPEESGDDHMWYYYNFDSCGVTFISQTSSDIVNDEWYVEFLESYPPTRIKDLTKLETLINLLNEIQNEQDTP
jgi:hypothetical protein